MLVSANECHLRQNMDTLRKDEVEQTIEERKIPENCISCYYKATSRIRVP